MKAITVKKIKKNWKSLSVKKFGDLDITKSFRKMNKDSSLLSYNFNSLYPCAEADEDSKWPAIETSFPFERFLSDAICELFNSSRWEEVNGSAFLTVKFHNPENLIFQHILTKEKLNNPQKRID